jgi:hypothetical protein
MIGPSRRSLPENTQHSKQERHPCSRRDTNPRAAIDPRLRPRGHRDRRIFQVNLSLKRVEETVYSPSPHSDTRFQFLTTTFSSHTNKRRYSLTGALQFHLFVLVSSQGPRSTELFPAATRNEPAAAAGRRQIWEPCATQPCC